MDEQILYHGSPVIIRKPEIDKGKPYNDFVRIVELENEMSVGFLKLKLLPISPHLRIVNNKEYTIKNPKIIINPYGISPLTALIILQKAWLYYVLQ